MTQRFFVGNVKPSKWLALTIGIYAYGAYNVL